MFCNNIHIENTYVWINMTQNKKSQTKIHNDIANTDSGTMTGLSLRLYRIIFFIFACQNDWCDL